MRGEPRRIVRLVGCKDLPPHEVDHYGGCNVCPADHGEACRPLPRDIIRIGPQPKRRGGWAGRKARARHA